MTALSYLATKGRVTLRLVAYQPKLEPVPEGCLRVVVQVVEGGQPIAEDPLHVEAMTPLDLARALHISRFEGWELEPWEGSA